MLNTALILGEDHPWKELYAPGRIPLKAAKNLCATGEAEESTGQAAF